MAYAENTTVSVDQSKNEIERTLKRYGATGFMYGWQDNLAMVAFEIQGIRVRFNLPMPERAAFMRTPSGNRMRTKKSADDAYEAEVRRRWRAMTLVVKAKLEAVESQITTLQQEFLANIVLPGGETVGQRVLPMLEQAQRTGNLPPLLPTGMER